jgi:hypothetical protein
MSYTSIVNMVRRKLPELKPTFEKLEPTESKYLSRWPAIVCAYASTGLGKTHWTLGLIKLLIHEGTITKLYVFCANVKSNAIFTAVLKPSHWVFEDVMNAKACYAALDEVQKDASAIAEAYMDELEWVLSLRKFKSGETVTHKDELLLQQFGYEERIPKKPGFAVILDDCAQSPLLARHTNKLNKLPNAILSCRHWAEGLGVSFFITSQDTRSVPSVIRKNLTHLAAWRTMNEKEIRNLYEDTGCMCEYATFKDYFLHCTSEKHEYMFVDAINRTITDSF